MKKCLICNKDFKNNRGLGAHIRRTHNKSTDEYKQQFNLFRRCLICNKKLSRNCKQGNCCNSCRDRTGENNSFYGKTHTQKTKDHLSVVSKITTRKLWLDNEYRNNVIQNMIGKRRSQKFKNGQRRNALKQFQDENQRKLRSKIMKQSWKDGKIQHHSYCINVSKGEKELFNFLKCSLKNCVERKTLHYSGKWYFPDILIDDKFIIEYNGDYWHAHPDKYNSGEIVHHNILAKTIWQKDKIRLTTLKKMNFKVLVIWESEYKELTNDQLLNKVQNFIDQ